MLKKCFHGINRCQSTSEVWNMWDYGIGFDHEYNIYIALLSKSILRLFFLKIFGAAICVIVHKIQRKHLSHCF